MKNKSVEWTGKFNDENVDIKTITPTPAIVRQADGYVAAAFKEALDRGALLRIQIDLEIKKRGVDSQKQEDEEIAELQKVIKEKEVSLLSGKLNGRKLTKQEGRALALEIRVLRTKMFSVGASSNQLYAKTAEKLSEDERQRYYIYSCTLSKDTGRPFFKSFDDFKDNIDDDFVAQATEKFYSTYIGADFLDKTVEIKWLVKYGFMNEQGQLINEKNELVDMDGRRINAEGRLIDENGNTVDMFGNPVDSDGNLIITEVEGAYKT